MQSDRTSDKKGRSSLRYKKSECLSSSFSSPSSALLSLAFFLGILLLFCLFGCASTYSNRDDLTQKTKCALLPHHDCEHVLFWFSSRFFRQVYFPFFWVIAIVIIISLRACGSPRISAKQRKVRSKECKQTKSKNDDDDDDDEKWQKEKKKKQRWNLPRETWQTLV